MSNRNEFNRGVAIFTEMEEFAGFSMESQRYIRRSLDIAGGDPRAIARWSQDRHERSAVEAQAQIYERLNQMRGWLRKGFAHERQSAFLALLIELSSFDLDSGELDGFAPFRFLYERLLGSRVRPWLPSAFCAVALLPEVKPMRRACLLSTLGDAAIASWSKKEPAFHPEQIAA
jgi:hypothetical protein